MVVFTGRGVLQGKQVTVLAPTAPDGVPLNIIRIKPFTPYWFGERTRKTLRHCQVSHKELILKSQLPDNSFHVMGDIIIVFIFIKIRHKNSNFIEITMLIFFLSTLLKMYIHFLIFFKH